MQLCNYYYIENDIAEFIDGFKRGISTWEPTLEFEPTTVIM